MDTKALINSIKPDSKQPRKIFDEEHIKGLAQSLLIEGMINPIEVDSDMMIITGECRFKAAHLLGWTEVPIRINPEKYSEYERLRHQMAENIHQSGTSADSMMNPIDTAKGYAKLLNLKGYKVTPGVTYAENGKALINELGTEIGVAQSTIYQYLELLEQPEFVQKDILEGRPRTYYRAANEAPDEVKNKMKEKIAGGDYRNREDIIQDVQLLKKLPDLGQLVLARQKAKESLATNRILNGAARLGLALEALPFEQVDIRERNIIITQLKWMMEKIQEYLQ